uniref:Uncharacterized protein n=1 Tax=Anguilla anguilla TaxID=7936 RepID=A0A0E9PX08_ANGAN
MFIFLSVLFLLLGSIVNERLALNASLRFKYSMVILLMPLAVFWQY